MEKEFVNILMVLMILFLSIFQPNACHFNDVDANFSATLESLIFFVADSPHTSRILSQVA